MNIPCEMCRKPATVHVTEREGIRGVMAARHLCGNCATSAGFLSREDRESAALMRVSKKLVAFLGSDCARNQKAWALACAEFEKTHGREPGWEDQEAILRRLVEGPRPSGGDLEQY